MLAKTQNITQPSLKKLSIWSKIILKSTFLDYQYDYNQGEAASFDTQHYSNHHTNERQQIVPESPPSPVYVPSQHSQPVVKTTTTASSDVRSFVL